MKIDWFFPPNPSQVRGKEASWGIIDDEGWIFLRVQHVFSQTFQPQGKSTTSNRIDLTILRHPSDLGWVPGSIPWRSGDTCTLRSDITLDYCVERINEDPLVFIAMEAIL